MYRGLNTSVSLLLWCLVSSFIHVSAVTVLEGRELSPTQRLESRKLSAASPRSNLQSRSDVFTLSNEVELIYAEGDHYGMEASNLAAKVRLGSDNPILVLEEIEHLLHDIECTSGSVRLSTSDAMGSHMCDQLHSLKDGHLITSHDTCNNATGRQAYKVLSITQLTLSTISLEVIRVSWRDKKSFSSLSVSLADESSSIYNVRSHASNSARLDLSKRQVADQSASFSFNIAPTVASYVALPSTTPQGSSYSFDLSNIGPFINTQYPLHNPGTLDAAPVAVGCDNCTFWGTLGLTFANFAVDLESESISGTATMAAKGVGAHVYLATNLTDTWYFQFPLRSLGYALEIADFGSIDFGVGIDIAGGYNMQGSVMMRYGFDMTVPDTAALTLDVGDPSSSTEVDFEHTHFTALPFSSHASIQALDLWLALRTAVTTTLTVEDSTLGDAGAYIDVPRMSAKVTPVENVDANCKPLSHNTPNHDGDKNILTDVIKVDVYGSWDYGAYARLKYVDIPVPNYFVPAGKVKVQTMCLNFDKDTQSYSTAEDAVQGKGALISTPTMSLLALMIVFAMIVLL